MSITKTGLSLYFASNRAGGSGGLDIWVSQRASISAPWEAPRNLGPTINSDANDQCPFVTPDGHKLIFVSYRSGGAGQGDIYMSFRKNNRDDLGWEAPAPLTALNTAADEFGPWGFEDPRNGSLVLYFNSNRPGGAGGQDIYASTMQSDGTFAAPALVPELSTSADDTYANARPDGLELYLTSTRPGGFGSSDIWISSRSSLSEPWGEPVNAGPIVNSSAAETRASSFGDGTRLFFGSTRTGGAGGNDAYEAVRSRSQVIPIVGAVVGAMGQRYKTTADLTNSAATTATGKLVFRAAGAAPAASDPTVSYTLAPFETRTFADLMGDLGVSGIGTLEIYPESGAAPSAAVRIQDGGVVMVPAVNAENILTAGSRGVLTAPADLNAVRFNIGLRTLESGATLTISVYGQSGTAVRTSTRSFPPNYGALMPAADFIGGTIAPQQSIVISVVHGSAVVYGSVASNTASGSSLQIAQRVTD